MGEDGSGDEASDLSLPLASQRDENAAIFWTFVAFASGVLIIRILPYGIKLFS